MQRPTDGCSKSNAIEISPRSPIAQPQAPLYKDRPATTSTPFTPTALATPWAPKPDDPTDETAPVVGAWRHDGGDGPTTAPVIFGKYHSFMSRR